MKEVKKSSVRKAAPKAAAKKPVTRKAPVKKAVAPKKAAAVSSSKPAPTPEQRYCMIQEAAYFIAERHGFNGDSAYFWSLAEAEINDRLG